jgi:large subunit ribosomal protein L19e
LKLSTQRKLAAKILGVGVNRVWIDPAKAAEVSTAISREDVYRLIRQGAIEARPVRGVSRARARELAKKMEKGRRRGHGSRSGTAKARMPSKRAWIKTVRPLREKLRELKEKHMIDVKEYRRLYRMVSGGSFKSKAHLETYLKERGILR